MIYIRVDEETHASGCFHCLEFAATDFSVCFVAAGDCVVLEKGVVIDSAVYLLVQLLVPKVFLCPFLTSFTSMTFS